MKAIFHLVFLCLIFPAVVKAQLPYTSSNAVPWHLERVYDIRENNALDGQTIPLITAGTEVIWDFSSLDLAVSPEETWYFEPASVTPYQSNYPSANLVAWYTNSFGNSEYLYMNNSPFELRLLGGVLVENDNPQMIPFCPDPFLIMDYPMNIGSGVQHNYTCPEAQGEVDNWVILATGSIAYQSQTIEDVVMWRSVYTGPGYSDTAYFWTQYDNVLYPVARYRPGSWARLRFPISETVLNTTDIDDADVAFEVYPNPVSDQLYIQVAATLEENVTVIIYDALGRNVKEAGMLRSTEGRFDLYVGDLQPGSYMIELRSASGPLAARRTFIRQ